MSPKLIVSEAKATSSAAAFNHVVRLSASSRPRELGGRETGFAFILDPEGVDLRAGRLRDRQVRRYGVKHAVEPNRLTGLHTKGHDVLDLEIDHFADPDAVANTVVLHLDRHSLDTKHLPDQGRQ